MVAHDPDMTAAPVHTQGRLFSAPPLLMDLLQDAGLPLPEARSDVDLATILRDAPLDDGALLSRARNAMDWWAKLELCNFPADQEKISYANAPYVLVIDQADPAITVADFQEMLVFAQTEHLNSKVVILPCENGVAQADMASDRITLADPKSNPWTLFASAMAVYTHSSGLGFDAIFAGHRPRVFGQPWYGGLDLTQDEAPDPHRNRRLTRAQAFAAAMLLYPNWKNRHGAPCLFEDILAHLEATERARREDANGYVASHILRWKRPFLRQYFGSNGIEFTDAPHQIAAHVAQGRRQMIWGSDAKAALRLEDGFLRSRGLGAALVRPVSLILDDQGLYFDPTRPSRLEALISARTDLSTAAAHRIDGFLTRLKTLNLSKYNVGAGAPTLPGGHRILVAGQVEDDASVRLGTGQGAGEISTNRALLMAARAAHPSAVIVYKPHPDVEAGLRRGKVADADAIADVVAQSADPLALIEACDEVWTMTSLIGFEALLRGTPVTCTGAPFYAGWGLTQDLGNTPARRAARPSLKALAHAVLIDYPRYFDPQTGTAIAPEEALDLLAHAPQGRSRLAQTMLARLRQLRAATLGLNR
ncbi:beta-3-deoxy-D-manno-oct-2-ulosonic acid transferase [Celeribacter baekdonensis]|uniref:Beta-3-deoxy-D-manno-oct-2-ulosonic acid transferase n=2 Tax=Celeribacter baekdonensis TaxID=875171 RepID=A0A2R4LZZ4_9RHOB|nr:beta-3-deoxy-D-manno-oct-2-ulosonic acid transferase [Celeribacter baekdonensis]